jgi:hypothetical protein
MDARNAIRFGVDNGERESCFISRPLQRKGRRSQQGGTADNSQHTELFHDRSP